MAQAGDESGPTAPQSPLGSLSSTAFGPGSPRKAGHDLDSQGMSGPFRSRSSVDEASTRTVPEAERRKSNCGSHVGDPVPEMARQGRDKQRYADTGERLVAGCIPFHRAALAREDGVDGTSDEAGGDGRGLADDPGGAGLSGGAARVRVMLITSRGGKGWVFPKGGWETDEEAGDAAKRETVEEAGARGTLSDVEVGVFKFHSGKQERRCQADRGRCIAHMFALEVQEVLESWPEGKERRRIWCSPQDAHDLLRHPWMKTALATWAKKEGIPLDTTTWAKEPKPMVAAKDVDTNVSAGSFTVPGTSLPVVTTFS